MALEIKSARNCRHARRLQPSHERHARETRQSALLESDLPTAYECPQEDPNRALNLGVAAHLAGAAPGSARYDANMTSEQRSAIENGIWLCQNCAKLIDNNPAAYSTPMLQAMRLLAEATARHELERGITLAPDDRFTRIERDMPELVAEMRNDLKQYPLKRRFYCAQKEWSVWSDAMRYATRTTIIRTLTI